MGVDQPDAGGAGYRNGLSGGQRRIAVTPPGVVIVDDDEELCTSLAWLLGSVHVESRCFADAHTFLDFPTADRPGCVVLDVRMPEISGFDVQHLLNRTGSTMPVVFVSARGDIRMSVRALQNGAVDFLEKPSAELTILGSAPCGRPSADDGHIVATAPPIRGVNRAGRTEPVGQCEPRPDRSRHWLLA